MSNSDFDFKYMIIPELYMVGVLGRSSTVFVHNFECFTVVGNNLHKNLQHWYENNL